MGWSLKLFDAGGRAVRIHHFFLLLVWAAAIYGVYGGLQPALAGILFVTATLACVIAQEFARDHLAFQAMKNASFDRAFKRLRGSGSDAVGGVDGRNRVVKMTAELVVIESARSKPIHQACSTTAATRARTRGAS
jgi:hypothetical protein